jgi:uncharacterized delta-60 repeat protein
VVWSAIEALESRRLLSGAVLTISGAPTAGEGQNYTLNLSASAGANLTTWTINWGDGTPSMPDLQTVPGSTASVIHQYADATTAYSVTATGTDGTNTFAANTSPGGVNGTLDASFGTGGKLTTSGAVANAVAVQSDGKIVVVGSASGVFSTSRYNADGTPDTTFGSGGTVTTPIGQADIPYAVAIQQDGKIVVAGESTIFGTNRRVAVLRYTSAGVLDTTFGPNLDGKFVYQFVSNTAGVGGGQIKSVVIDYNGTPGTNLNYGKILLGGGSGENSFSPREIAVGRLNTDGTADVSFGGQGNGFAVASYQGLSLDQANAIVLQPDGKIVAVGDSNSRDSMVRFNANGSLDTGFGASGFVFNSTEIGSFSSAALDASGNVVAAGLINNSWSVMRVSGAGVPDATFGNSGALGVETLPPAPTAIPTSIVIQSDGKIVVSGTTDGNGAMGDFVTARYNTDGSPDSGFGANGLVVTDFGSNVDSGNAMALLPDGRILVAGQTVVGSIPELAMEQFGVGVSATPVTVLVSDVAPQITLNNVPGSSAEGTAISSSASVSDFAPSELTNTWAVTKNGNAYASGTGTAINFTPNDNGTYVLTFTSNDSGGAVGTASSTVNVFNVAPTAAVSGDTIGVRGQARHISLAATDPSTVDTAAGFTYTINWGDGSANQVVLPGGSANPGHVYATIGNFHVSVTATDKDGGVSAAAAQTIAITPIALEGTTLAIGGLTADDLIILAQNSAGGSKNLYVSDDLLLLYKLKEALFTQVYVYQQDADGIFVAQNVSDAVYLVDANGNIISTVHAAHP